ncbi:hypothetical protein K458DRAFT_299329 [Lentithecium fluviatile CBS 122367]|uniref:Mitotic checkpoint regulator, MAD2B-interacting-domain-containing protein n=1 Tax=Lentithecium fluviatile CBS 122367 TaxID=1168545 RepID=A0A6G1J886_9PLEO|nr:hypothetical protein K458DRAFT_299329 [Lentithecium fluviatile CBS 122367]
MNLIAYSDSDDSGDDAPAVPKIAVKPAPKPAFQKVVDRSNPGKIKLNLPGVSRPQADKGNNEAEGPPAKKARTGGGAFSGFNAMLPAPKKPKVNVATDGPVSGKRGLGKGLGSGVNLRTGAEPAFKREPRITEADEYDENGNLVKKEPLNKEDFRALLNLPTPKSEQRADVAPTPVQEEESKQSEPEVKPVARPKFVPLSVGRGKKKKPAMVKRTVPASEGVTTSDSTVAVPSTAAETKAPARPKVSLFSISQEAETPVKTRLNETYQPLLYGASDDEETPIPDPAFPPPTQQQHHPTPLPHPQPTDPLSNLASELNLTPAERRQLFGRKGADSSLTAAKIVEFNTDSEYAHNEMLRQQGETVQHNALKSISGTGKNSLRSLVNVATSQKDALEDHFAQGRRNKREAGNKYGF